MKELRGNLILLSYLTVISSSTIFPVKVPWELPFQVAGGIFFLLTLIGAAKIHSRFPKKHDSAYDFDHVMKDGAYSLCRHPFYLCIILNQASIPIFFHSIIGGILWSAFLPVWRKLMIEEEKELLERFGEEYEEYMRKVPRAFPRIFRRIK